jgi:hypothetical protein
MDGHAAYTPVHRPVPARYAAYSANLLLLIGATGGEITGGELFPRAANSVTGWRQHAMLWRSQLSNEGFFSLAETLTLRRVWHDARTRDVVISLGGHRDAAVDLRWTYNELEPARRTGPVLIGLDTERAFLCSILGDTLADAMAPWHEMTRVIVFDERGGPATSPAHLLTRLMITAADGPTGVDDLGLMSAYESCLTAVSEFGTWDDSRYLAMLLRQLGCDAPRLPRDWLGGVLERLRRRIADDPALSEYTEPLFALLRSP